MAGGFCPDTSCAMLVNSRCVFYEGEALPYLGINTNDSIQMALQKIEQVISEGGGGSSVWGFITGTITNQTDLITYLSSNYTSQSRILTINGVAQDLSGDRTWNVGVVTSISPGTGISIGGTSAVPIITNTSPDQTVVLNAGTGISVTGTYPTFTISNTGSFWPLGGSASLTNPVIITGNSNTLALYAFNTTLSMRPITDSAENSYVFVGDSSGTKSVVSAWRNAAGTQFSSISVSGTGISIFSNVAGDININSAQSVIFTTNSVTRLAIQTNGSWSLAGATGSAGQVLTSNGSSGAPTWQTPSGGTVTSVSGTSNRITSTGGTTPVIDISSSYIGQSSITTLGTITTGVWNGTDISFANIAQLAANTVAANPSTGSGDIQGVALSASQILGRGASGNISAITLGTNLSMSGTTLNAAGGGGITNSAANNELMKSNGTNAVASGLFSSLSGDLTLGSGSIVGSRLISAESSSSTSAIGIQIKSSASFYVISSDNSYVQSNFLNSNVNAVRYSGTATNGAEIIASRYRGSFGSESTIVNGDTIGSLIFGGWDGSAEQYSAIIKGVSNGPVSTGTVPMDLVFLTGSSGASVTEYMRINSSGNISVFGTGSFGSGTKVMFIADASVIPSSNPTGGIINYAESGVWKYRDTAGNIITI